MPRAEYRRGSARAADLAETRSSEAADSTVDVDGLPGDERRVGAEQERHQRAYVAANIADTPHRNASDRLRVIVGRELLPQLDAVGLRERAYHVDADVVTTPFQGGDLRQPADRLFCRGVSTPLGFAAGAGPRAEVDD